MLWNPSISTQVLCSKVQWCSLVKVLIKMPKKKKHLCLVRQSWCEELHPEQSTMGGTSSIPQLGKGPYLGLSSIAMGIRLWRDVKAWCVWLSDILKHKWHAKLFWLEEVMVYCVKAVVWLMVCCIFSHRAGSPICGSGLSSVQHRANPEQKGVWGKTGFFICTLCSPSLSRSSCKMCSWNKHYFYS